MVFGVGEGWAEDLIIIPLPDKLVYEPGETAAFTITLENRSKVAFEGKLVVKAIWNMEDTKSLLEQNMRIESGVTNVVNVKWKGVPEVLGCEVRVDLVGDGGKESATASEYFNVCRHMDRLRIGIHGHGVGAFTYSSPAWLELISKRKVLTAFKYYINIGEYLIGKSDVWDLAPKEDEYLGSSWRSKTGLQKAIEVGHKYGECAVVYVASYGGPGLADLEVSLQNPEWLASNEYGQPDSCAADPEAEDKLRDQKPGMSRYGCLMGVNFNWMNKEALDYHVDQLIKNQRMFAVDGVRYDGEPGIAWGKMDIESKPFPVGKERLKEQLRLIKYIKSKIRKAIPSYLFMYNGGPAVGFGNPVDLEKGVIDSRCQIIVESGGAMCNELTREASNPVSEFHDWKKFADVMVSDVDLTRKAGGFAYAYVPWAPSIHKNGSELSCSMLLAAGNHPWFSTAGWDNKDDPGGSHFPIENELWAFATRFSALLWGNGIDRVRQPETLVAVSYGTGEIWWKQFVHRRVLRDGRTYVIVHLLNTPPTKAMGIVEQPLPNPIKDVEVRFTMGVKKAWLATARPGPARLCPKEVWTQPKPAPTYEAYGPLKYGVVPVEKGKVTVPELRVWTMVVAEMK